MYLVLIGAPGAGKGTQAVGLAQEFGLAHIASGDMFREAMTRGTLRGLQARAYVERGELVPDDVTTAMVVERLARGDCENGVILDGFPRNVAQAQALDQALRNEKKRVDLALYLSVPGDELLRRLSGRWLCRKCQASYHEVFNPPAKPGTCDRCGGELYQREDDTRATAERRLAVYFEQTTPVIDYYRNAGILDEVDGSRTIAEVSEALRDAVRRRARKI
ncbi:MAG TPA: adenylate kinase [Chloroflexota bacterium]|nr:adenylate kinase [Chloroflexota bacterium]